MSHFAEIDENNIVVRVLVGDNNLPNEGHDWFVENLGGRWIQTSYNSNFRKHYAAIGFYYDEDRDAFIPPKPEGTWVLDEDACVWVRPIPYPEIINNEWYLWDEETGNWVEQEPLPNPENQ